MDLAREKSEREHGIQISYDSAPVEWKATALEAVFLTAKALPEFVSHDVWEFFPPNYSRSHASALGNIMRVAQKNGWIQNTGRYRTTPLSAIRCNAKPIWQSLIYGDPDL